MWEEGEGGPINFGGFARTQIKWEGVHCALER